MKNVFRKRLLTIFSCHLFFSFSDSFISDFISGIRTTGIHCAVPTLQFGGGVSMYRRLKKDKFNFRLNEPSYNQTK